MCTIHKDDKQALVVHCLEISGDAYKLSSINDSKELHARMTELLAKFNELVRFTRGIPE